MAKRVKEKHLGNSWAAFFKTIRDLRLPWLWIFFALVLNLTETTLMLKLPVTTSNLMSGDISGSSLSEAVIYYALTGVIGVAAVAAMVHAQSYSVRRTRERVWKKMLGMRMDYFDRNDPSELMSAITNDSGAALNLVNIILNLIPAIYYVIGAMVTINEYHRVLALSCFMLIPIKYLYALIMGRVFQKSSHSLYNRIGNLTGYLADRITHLHLIKTYTNEKKEEANGENVANELLKANMRIVHQDNIASAFVAAMDVLQKFVVIIVAVILLQKKEINLAAWLAFFLFSQNLFSYMDQIFDNWTTIKSIQGCFYRITEIMQNEDEHSGDIKEVPEGGDIEFRNVTFTYPETEEPALCNVSFTIPAGSSAAIIGLCGSGKTTAISILERLYMPDEGSVLIGGTDIRDISLADFRRKLAYVQQGADIFSGTLREALTYGIDRPVEDEEIFAAAKKTGFDEYLSLCQNNLDTEIASGGGSMSGGQSQRLVLTREVLRGGSVILMDEPTSALDINASVKIQETMDTVFADKTRILVTHDLRFARKYDRIFVLSNGHLVGEGTHESLLESCEVYRTMNENAEEEEI